MTMFLMNTVTLILFFHQRGAAFTRTGILSVEVNNLHEMWAGRFWQALKVQHNAL